MSLIQNKSKGTYLFLSTKNDPSSTPIKLKNEIGRNAAVGPQHYRLVDDNCFKKIKRVHIVVVLKHHPGGQPLQWISQEIGPGEVWVFDGRAITKKDQRRVKADPSAVHGT